MAEQERLLRLERFGPDEAWALGGALREAALARGGLLAIDVSLRDRVLFHCALPGSTTDGAERIRRKRNTVLRLWRSSYAVGRSPALSGRTLEAAHALPLSRGLIRLRRAFARHQPRPSSLPGTDMSNAFNITDTRQ